MRKTNLHVFLPAGLVILLFVVLGVLFSSALGDWASTLQAGIVRSLGWFYVLAVTLFLIFVVVLMFSRFGRIRLGKDDAEPEYGYFTWFAMLFSAGMGIGLLFWSVAEPISHFGNPPTSAPGTHAAAREAMALSFFHWGLHAWAIYIVVALALAYFAYRHDLPLTIRSALYPLLGRHVHGPAGNLVDVLAIFGTVFGLATSLGLGTMQINAGLAHLELLSISPRNQLILLAAITLAATASVATGLNVGIRRLSELNIILALVLLLFVLAVGPTFMLLRSFVEGLGVYAGSLLELTFRTDAFDSEARWQQDWTVFYWGWWISWSPFVGMFIARISRGRTIREFIAGVMLVPSILTFLWLAVFGNTAIGLELFGEVAMLEAVRESEATALFVMLSELPFAAVTVTMTILVIAVFFVTSADSGSLVVSIFTSGGHARPPLMQRMAWALMIGAVAATLLLAGGLEALQTAAITTALPFSVIMVLICIGMVRALRSEGLGRTPDAPPASDTEPAPEGAGTAPAWAATPSDYYGGTMPARTAVASRPDDWRKQLRWIIHTADRYNQAPDEAIAKPREQFDRYLEKVVMPAFVRIQRELEANDRTASIERDDARVRLSVWRGDQLEFTYTVRGRGRAPMVFTFPEFTIDDPPPEIRVEVLANDVILGDHEIETWTHEQIVVDFVHAYGKWMGWGLAAPRAEQMEQCTG